LASSWEHIDATAGGAFFSLEDGPAQCPVEKIAANQGWSDERAPMRSRGVHQVDGMDMLVAKWIFS
jgi:hypothetical protein